MGGIKNVKKYGFMRSSTTRMQGCPGHLSITEGSTTAMFILLHPAPQTLDFRTLCQSCMATALTIASNHRRRPWSARYLKPSSHLALLWFRMPLLLVSDRAYLYFPLSDVCVRSHVTALLRSPSHLMRRDVRPLRQRSIK